MPSKLEVIPRAVAEKLENHTKVIHTLIAAQRRGAAEQFGYAFLAGRALLQAKSIVPNGHANAPNAGFKRWIEANFPTITMRTAENWMTFAESIIARAQASAANSPLLLGSVEMSGQSHESILQLVPEVMNGQGMMQFMRDCRLLRESESASPIALPSAPRKVTDMATKAHQFWERTLKNLEVSENFLTHIECAEDLNRYLNAIVSAEAKIRDFLKQRTISEKS